MGIWSYRKQTRQAAYDWKHCMKKLCKSLREQAKSTIDFEKKKILPLRKEELKSHQDAKACYICGKSFLKKFALIKIMGKLEIFTIT